MHACLEEYINKLFFSFTSKSQAAALKFLFFTLIFLCSSFCNPAAEARILPNVLLVGATLNDLNYEDRNRFKKYTIVERAYLKPENIKELVEECNPIAIVVKQSSGKIYEYSPSGEMIKEINTQSTYQSQKEDESKFNIPNQMNKEGNSQSLQNGMEVPVQINGQMKIGYPQNGNSAIFQSNLQAQSMPTTNAFPNGSFNTGSNVLPQMQGGVPFFSAFPQAAMQRPPAMGMPIVYGANPYARPSRMPMLGPYDGRTFGLGGRYGYYGNTASFGPPPMIMQQPTQNMNNPYPQQMGQGMQQQNFAIPPGAFSQSTFSRNPINGNSLPPPNVLANSNQPFPGGSIPEYMYPGTSEYSYMPGEGDIAPSRGLSIGRQAIKQTAALAQNMTFPFWFDNYLTTDTSASNLLGNSLGGAASGTNAGFPNLQFNADTTANASVVAGQWTQTGLGLGSLIADSILDKREIDARRQAARTQAAGTPYYNYPDSAYTSYPSMPYQPMPYYAGY